ncbi:family 16 glycosylhydrolase [Nocardioides sp. B-3]|uniref:family 16 glycosylhydrolase n=1 Tax=Nocardioides sp. B-3 TaxID=2895565 RepID=UPI002152DB3D|nr:family 16 glycosylhydrolase [Nocardioides sp. B-3]UUZ58967.1 family 16 glycosylhydrolase [Nocardioides sp. B-3]
MTSPRATRRLRTAAALASAVLASLLSPVLSAGPASADHAGAEPGPINAASTFGWWNKGILWREEFEAPYTGQMGPQWVSNGPGQVWHQNGMLTLNATSEGTVSATLAGAGDEVGRWETRLRSRQYGRGNARYRVLAELVPAAGAEEHCGARNIALASYTPNGRAATVYARTLPNVAYKATNPMSPGRDQWHTYAVEVTRERISWFIDAHVVYTENRDDVLTGVPLTVRFTMEAKPDRVMNVSRMQMDWVRHWSLEAPNLQPVDAPPTRAGVYGKAC